MASSLTNIAQVGAGGLERAQFVLSTSGRPYGTLPSAGSGAGMTILEGANNVTFNFPSYETLSIPGDNSVDSAILFKPGTAPTMQLQFARFNGSFNDTVQGVTVDDAQSIYNIYGIDPETPTFPDIFLLLTGKAVSKDSGSEGNGYDNWMFPLCQVGYTGPNGMQTGTNARLHTFDLTLNRVNILPWGESFSDYVSGFYFFSEGIPTFDIFVQNNSDTSYTPTQTLNANEQVIGFDSAALGAGATLATSVSSGDFTFSAQTSGNVSTFLYEVA
jgi:hypothetical protein